jgi:F-type H+-transporting ATPase subunit epsilon
MSSFYLQIVTPDGSLFDGQAEKLTVRTIDGDVTVLAGHTDYVTALGMGRAKVTVEGIARYAACIGGMLLVSGGKVKLVATTFEWTDEIDVARAGFWTKRKSTRRPRSRSPKHGSSARSSAPAPPKRKEVFYET